jgi:hypothetical protein
MKIRTTIYKVLITITSIFGCVVSLYLLNFAIVTPIIIGDPEAYDSGGKKTGKVFDLFYEISAVTGFHPEPSDFNYLLTIFAGAILGGFIAFKWSKGMRKG